jgi:cell division protein FtsW (lipid II flippase)
MQLGGYKTFLQQLAWAGLGLLLMAFFARFDYHKLGKLSWVGLFASIALLVLVLAIGKDSARPREPPADRDRQVRADNLRGVRAVDKG